MKYEKLIFVYNAKSGFMHSIYSLMQKKVSPNTYPCKLCSLTYSGATMKKIWQEYVKGLNIQTEFLHKDEFIKKYPQQTIKFPTVILKDEISFKVIIRADEFENIKNLSELMRLIEKNLHR
jgi:hypothetical protein